MLEVVVVVVAVAAYGGPVCRHLGRLATVWSGN